MARSKRAKQWTGVLAEPIDDVALIPPLKTGWTAGSPELQKWLDLKHDRLHQHRINKMPELARQIGMEVDKFDLTTTAGRVVFYGELALNLALKLEIPGFMEIKPKWHPAIVLLALQYGDERRKRRERNPDLAACLMIVQALDRKLRRKDQKPAAIKRAKTLRNEVSKLRRKIVKGMVDDFIGGYTKAVELIDQYTKALKTEAKPSIH